MGLLDWVRRMLDRDVEVRRRLIHPSRPYREKWALESSEVIFAAINRISTSMGSMPCRLYRDMTPQTGELNSLVAVSPKSGMTPFEFFRTLEVDRDTEGNGYALVVPSLTGGVAELAIQEPSRVTPMKERDSGELWYKLQLTEGTQPTIFIHNSRMIHVRHISPDGIRGISPLKVLNNTLEYSAQISEFTLKQVRGGVHAGIALDFPAEMSKQKRSDAIEQFLELYRESEGAVIALDAGVRATRLDTALVDPKILDVDRITRVKVASVYNLPPHLLGDYSSSGYASIEQQTGEFVALTMDPLATMYAQELNRVLLTRKQIDEGMTFRFDVNRLLMTDSATRSNNAFRMVRSGGMSPNEARRIEGRAPSSDPLADELWISKDMVPLRVAAGQSVAPDPPPETNAKGGRGNGRR